MPWAWPKKWSDFSKANFKSCSQTVKSGRVHRTIQVITPASPPVRRSPRRKINPIKTKQDDSLPILEAVRGLKDREQPLDQATMTRRGTRTNTSPQVPGLKMGQTKATPVGQLPLAQQKLKRNLE